MLIEYAVLVMHWEVFSFSRKKSHFTNGFEGIQFPALVTRRQRRSQIVLGSSRFVSLYLVSRFVSLYLISRFGDQKQIS
jgi:hypothetical protein